jgi:hypothetical protein
VDSKAQLMELRGTWRYRAYVYALRIALVCFLSGLAVVPVWRLLGLSVASSGAILMALFAVTVCCVLGGAISGAAIFQRYGRVMVYEQLAFVRGVVRDILRYRKPGK